jgi:hypothetical protein
MRRVVIVESVVPREARLIAIHRVSYPRYPNRSYAFVSRENSVA